MYISTIQFATPEYDEAVQLRTAVLRAPLGLAFDLDFLSQEYNDTHIVAYAENGTLLGILLLTQLDTTTVKMRQVAVHFDYQKKGVGKALVAYSEKYARGEGYTFMQLNARSTAVVFYQKLGYETVGEEFVEVSIPHFAMRKAL